MAATVPTNDDEAEAMRTALATYEREKLEADYQQAVETFAPLREFLDGDAFKEVLESSSALRDTFRNDPSIDVHLHLIPTLLVRLRDAVDAKTTRPVALDQAEAEEAAAADA